MLDMRKKGLLGRWYKLLQRNEVTQKRMKDFSHG